MSEGAAKTTVEPDGSAKEVEAVVATVEDAPTAAVVPAESDVGDASRVRPASSEIMEAPEIVEERDELPLSSKQSLRQESASLLSDGASQGSWGWGGWATSLTTAVSSFTEEAAKAAAEVSKTAAAAAKGVVDSIEAEVKAVKDDVDKNANTKADDSAAAEEDRSEKEEKDLSEEDKKRLSALERLENASKDSVLGQGLKVFDDSVETITMGAYHALGTAWKGSLNLVHKLEHSAETIAETIQHGGLVKAGTEFGPSLLESGRAFTAKAGKALETVSKEALGLLAEEAGFHLEKDQSEEEDEVVKEAFAEEVTFEHCFYIYGGPDHLEELEELANHHTLLCNRARAKLSGEDRSAFDASLKQLHLVLTLEREGEDTETGGKGKGKELEPDVGSAGAEVQKMREASVIKAAEMSSGFTSSLRGLAMAEVVERTADRLEAIKAEGIHRVSELCALCILHLLQLGQAALASGAKQGSEADAGSVEKTEGGPAPSWPEDCMSKAELITARAQSMEKDLQAVVGSFLNGISDVIGAFKATLPESPKVAEDAEGEGVRQELLKVTSVEERATAASSGLETDREVAVSKVEAGLQQLAYVLLSTTVKSQ